jgi:protein gp37
MGDENYTGGEEVNKSKINWGVGQLWTWNPITGCKRSCPWCYAKRIHDRFHPDVPFSEIQVHKERFDDPDLWRKAPCTVFVGSMSDPEYWPKDEFKRVIDVCWTYHKNTYMFLSKNPMAYHGYNFPPNTMQGLTMTCTQTQHCQGEMIEQMEKYPRPFLSIEPLLGNLQVRISSKFEKVICGAMTGPGAVKPDRTWIDNVNFNTTAKQIFWKDSVGKYL